MTHSIKIVHGFLALAGLLAGCGNGDSLSPEQYAQSDALFTQVASNVSSASSLKKIVEIDHSRLGGEAGSVMPPARVLIFSNPRLETEFIKRNQLIGLDLPLRVLVYGSETGTNSKLIYNSLNYLELRYEYNFQQDIEKSFQDSMALALKGIDPSHIAAFERDSMPGDGITNIASPFDFETTLSRVQAAIDVQDSVVVFGRVDFSAGVGPHSLRSMEGQPCGRLKARKY